MLNPEFCFQVASLKEINKQSQEIVEEEWEYRLPSPPSAFRDSRSHSPTVTEFDTVTLAEVHLNPVENVRAGEDKPFGTGDLADNNVEPTALVEPEAETNKATQSTSFPQVTNTSASVNEEKEKSKEKLSLKSAEKLKINETVIHTAQTVINSTNVPNDVEKRKLEGPAAVLDELNRVLTEQRCSNVTTHQSVPSRTESVQHQVHEPAPIQNFSMTTYSRQNSSEAMPPPEVRPSLVLARRSSFSNSNGSLNTIPRPLGTGVRRTTSHATLVGARRESNTVNEINKSIENLASCEERNRSNYNVRRESQTLGRAVSEMNLCAGLC